jgi:ribonuclease R
LTDREMAGLGSVAEHITMTERRAMAAERDSTDRYVAAFMEDRIGETFDARVTGVTRFGLFVRLADSGAEGLIPIRSLGSDFFQHDEKRQALVGSRTRVSFSMGQALAVKLLEAAPLTGGLRFALLDGRGADGAGGAPHAAGKPRTGKPGKRPGKDRFRGKKR